MFYVILTHNESVRLVQPPFGHGSGFGQDWFGPEQIILVQDWFGRRTVPAGKALVSMQYIHKTILFQSEMSNEVSSHGITHSCGERRDPVQ